MGRYTPPISTLALFVLCGGEGEVGGCNGEEGVLSRKLHSPENCTGVIFLYEHLPSLFICHGTLNFKGDGVRKSGKSSTEPEFCKRLRSPGIDSKDRFRQPM